MLIYSMGVSVDGYVTDRDGGFDWTVPGDNLFTFHLEQVGALGAYLLGRHLYETMHVWETDPSLRETTAGAAFADVWSALPKIVFSRTLDRVDGNARLARASVPDEIAAVLAASVRDVAIGGPGLAGQAIEVGFVDEFRMLRYPIVVGGGTPYLPVVDRAIQLELVETREFGARVVYERYRRIR